MHTHQNLRHFGLRAALAGIWIAGSLASPLPRVNAQAGLAHPGSPIAMQVSPAVTQSPDGDFSGIWYDGAAQNVQCLAWGDYDGDGDLDLAASNLGANRLYQNDGSGALQDVTPSDWLSLSEQTYSLAWGDYDGDGDLDLAVGNNGVNRLYRNEGNHLFSDATPASWLSLSEATYGLAWGDYDGDGLLDLAVGNNGMNRLFHNTGDGNFSDATPASFSTTTSRTNSLAWGDMDGDGDLDLAMGNQGVNQLFRNDGAGSFTELSGGLGSDPDQTQKLAWGDMDGDGDLDLAVGNTPKFFPSMPGVFQVRGGVRLYRNDGGGIFTFTGDLGGGYDSTQSLGWGDLDGDGDLDLVVGNAQYYYTNFMGDRIHVDGGAYYYLNNGSGSLSGPTAVFPSSTYRVQSVVTGDVDLDGDLDLATGSEQYDYWAGVWVKVPGGIHLHRNQGLFAFQVASQYSLEKRVSSIAWGDYDNDGDLDLAVASVGGVINWPPPTDHSLAIYRNDGGALEEVTSGAMATTVNSTHSVAWGDMDGDGDLDLAAGNYGPNTLYRNDGGGVFTNATPGSISSVYDYTNSVAWGDADGDGDLDLAVGNGDPSSGNTQVNRLYRNDGGGAFTYLPAALGSDLTLTRSLAWGDLDGDGDLDLAAGNVGPNHLYRNEGQNVFSDMTPANMAAASEPTQSVALGDVDGDGDLDLAAGNIGVNRLYRNDGQGIFTDRPGALGVEVDQTYSLALGDMDQDGDLDLAVGNDGPDKLFRNDGTGTFSEQPAALGSDPDPTNTVSWGQLDNDGDLDLAIGNNYNYDRPYRDFRLLRNLRFTQNDRLPDAPPVIHTRQPDDLPAADFYAVDGYLTQTSLPVSFTLTSPRPGPIGKVKAYYSLNGGGSWAEALPAAGAQTNNLLASPSGNSYTFLWDTFASRFFGQSDNLALRLEAYPQPALSAAPSTYTYPNLAPDPSLRVKVAATTFPFRARGAQVRVVDTGGAPVQDALVYRLPQGQTASAQPMASTDGTPFRSDALGYLQGRGEIGLQDTLYALAPISTTQRYALYATNGLPAADTLLGYTVSQPGLQQVAVSPEHPLLVFNLDLTLEWDPRNDPGFLEDLELAVQQASAVLFDISDGQIALGEVRLRLDRQGWTAADVILYAQSGIRPRASMGGVVDQLVDDVDKNGSPIPAAYGPGQIRIGPNWDPFASSTAELTVDWQRALAHELAHYLLFLPDNYLGVKDGQPVATDCRGSFMTSTYDDDYSEFLIRPAWSGECTDTIAEATTGRVDWETLLHFYQFGGAPMLHAPLDLDHTNPGPATLPLAVTRVALLDPGTAANSLPPRIFDIRSAANGQLTPAPRAQVFLFHQNGTPSDLSDDALIPLGSTLASGDRVKVRGALPGDRLCLFGPPAPLSGDSLAGCIPSLKALDASIPVDIVAGWQPNIAIQAVTSTTLQVTVTLPVSQAALNMQFFPAYGEAGSLGVEAPVQPMLAADGGTRFTGSFALPAPAFEGWLRVWAPSASPLREALTQVFLSPPWGPNRGTAGNDANRRAWGANFRQLGAPVASGDGQVSIFNFKDIFADTGTLSLQALNALPSLPSWLSQVGQGYRFRSEKSFPRAIAFDYLQREVPPGYEYTLTIYYSPDEGQTWQRLDTRLEMAYNRATAVMPTNDRLGQGIYALLATVEMPALSPGWNLFAYTIPQTRTVELALASIDGSYTSVYANHSGAWRLYDATVLPEFTSLVNDLPALEMGRAYWIYATQVITPYLGVPAAPARQSGLFRPPATYYGWVQPHVSFDPQAGMTVQAWVGGQLCGETKVVEWLGDKAYKIQVAAAEGDACGAAGRPILFTVDGQPMRFNPAAWDDRHAHFLTLGPPSNPIYLPLILSGEKVD